MDTKVKDITGKKFGMLTVIEYVETKNHRAMFKCVCDCGKECVKVGSLLTAGKTRSCGCLAKNNTDQTTHGLSKTHLYGVWCTMKSRCHNKNSQRYSLYGGRGVVVCDEWLHDFKSFYDWSYANGYNEKLTLDRIDVNGNYSPENCRWVDMKTQNNNRRNNNLMTYNGKTQTLHQWADEYGIRYGTLWARINTYNWSIEKALNTN